MDKPIKIKKERKRPQGEFRDKERTKLKLIHAVGEIIRTEGYPGLGVNRIAAKAGVNKKLIYRYFDSVDNLIEIYIRGKDYWATLNEKLAVANITENNFNDETVSELLGAQLELLSEDEEMKQIVLWEIGNSNGLIQDISGTREKTENRLLKLIDPLFDKDVADFKTILALQTAGIYYLALHATQNEGKFFGINVHSKTGRNRVRQAIKQINSWAFDKVEKKTKKKP